MTLWPGDRIGGDDGRRFEIDSLVAYCGKEGCQDGDCRFDSRYPDRCMDWHCSLCDEPCSSMGHKCPLRKQAAA